MNLLILLRVITFYPTNIECESFFENLVQRKKVRRNSMLSIFHAIHEIVRVVLTGYSLPSKAKEIFPVSSETTSTSASLCSERPIAAR